MGTIRINGISITWGRNVQVTNGNVFVDGKNVTPEGKSITIEIQGDVANLQVDACDRVTVTGNVKALDVKSGDIHCQDVQGSVTTMAGDVTCGNVQGSVKTMAGDINYRR